MQELLRRIERAPDTTMPRSQARLLARTLVTRKYLRISKHRLDAYSQATQDDDIFEAIERESFLAPEVGYEDHISAGGRLIRHDFDRMRNDAHERKFGMLIVGRADRFSRNITMGMLHTFELILAGVYVYFCDEDVIAGLDQNWREIVERKISDANGVLRTITKNNRTTARRRRRNGEWLGRAPFGWQLSPDRLVVSKHPTEWPVVERMIDLLRADRLSLQGIATTVTGEGHLTRQGLPIRKHFVHEVLRHPLLKGYWPINKKLGKGSPDYAEVKKFEGPLSEAEFDELQALLRGRADAHQSPEKIVRDYVLLRLLRCGEIDPATQQVCATALYGITSRRARTNDWYVNYFHPPFKGCCKTATVWQVSERHLLGQLDALFGSASLPSEALEVMAAYLGETAGAARVDRDHLRGIFTAELDRADLGYPHGAYGRDPRVAFEKWQLHRAEVIAKIAGLGDDPPPLREHEIQQVRDLPQLWCAGNTAERRQTMRALFSALYVVREPEPLPSGKLRSHNVARISRMEPRPEYADLIGYAFSGLMSDQRSLKSHRPQTEFGDAARAIARWLGSRERDKAA
jgi:DNA invertase Pin-like site-specific DNA recombinase